MAKYKQNMNKKEPLLLSAALLLSIIGSITGVIMYFLSALFFDKAQSLIIHFTDLRSMQGINALYFDIFGALYALSLSGVILMKKRYKKGFYLYTTSQIVILFIPVLWLGGGAFSFVNLIFTLLFITIYLGYLKYLK